MGGYASFTLLRLIERWRRPVLNLILVLLLFGCERAVARYIFDCPCSLIQEGGGEVPEMRVAYGALFMGLPAFIFWMLGIVMQGNTWRCITGWRIQRKFLYPGRSCGCVFSTIAKSSMPPIAWMVFVLLDGRYLDCSMSTVPSKCLDHIRDDSKRQEYREESDDIILRSQIGGLALAAGLLLFYFLVMMLGRCCSSMPYYEYQFAERMEKIEQQTFDEAIQEEYRGAFRKKWRELFSQSNKADWLDVSELPDGGPVQEDPHVYYTPFHAWQSDAEATQAALNSTFTKAPPFPTEVRLSQTAPQCMRGGQMADPTVSPSSHRRVSEYPPEYEFHTSAPLPQLRPNAALDNSYHRNSTEHMERIPGKAKKSKKIKKSQIQDAEA